MTKLKELSFYQPQSELKQHQETLEAYFRKHPPKTLAQAAAKIEELTGIVRSRGQKQRTKRRLRTLNRRSRQAVQTKQTG